MEPKLRIALLTTDTPHHRWFANRIPALSLLVLETAHTYELGARDVPFGNEPWPYYPMAAHTPHCGDNNGMIAAFSDLAISFGVGKLAPATFNAPRYGTINVHRGLTQWHRGLDSEYHAILRGEPIGVTIHQVAERLDAGTVVAQQYQHDGHGIEPAFDGILHDQTNVAAALVSRLLRNGYPYPPGPYYTAATPEQKAEARRLWEART